jgi:hypothetical protein
MNEDTAGAARPLEFRPICIGRPNHMGRLGNSQITVPSGRQGTAGRSRAQRSAWTLARISTTPQSQEATTPGHPVLRPMERFLSLTQSRWTSARTSGFSRARRICTMRS